MMIFPPNILKSLKKTTILFSAKDPKTNSSISLNLYDDNFHRFEIQNSQNEIQVVWYGAEVPIRTWNSICIVRDTSNFKFQVYTRGHSV